MRATSRLRSRRRRMSLALLATMVRTQWQAVGPPRKAGTARKTLGQVSCSASSARLSSPRMRLARGWKCFEQQSTQPAASLASSRSGQDSGKAGKGERVFVSDVNPYWNLSERSVFTASSSSSRGDPKRCEWGLPPASDCGQASLVRVLVVACVGILPREFPIQAAADSRAPCSTASTTPTATCPWSACSWLRPRQTVLLLPQPVDAPDHLPLRPVPLAVRPHLAIEPLRVPAAGARRRTDGAVPVQAPASFGRWAVSSFRRERNQSSQIGSYRKKEERAGLPRACRAEPGPGALGAARGVFRAPAACALPPRHGLAGTAARRGVPAAARRLVSLRAAPAISIPGSNGFPVFPALFGVKPIRGNAAESRPDEVRTHSAPSAARLPGSSPGREGGLAGGSSRRATDPQSGPRAPSSQRRECRQGRRVDFEVTPLANMEAIPCREARPPPSAGRGGKAPAGVRQRSRGRGARLHGKRGPAPAPPEFSQA